MVKVHSERFKHAGWASGLPWAGGAGIKDISMKYNINYLHLLKKKLKSSFLLIEKTRKCTPNKRIFSTEHRHKHQPTSDIHNTLALLLRDICSSNLCARSAVKHWMVFGTQSVFAEEALGAHTITSLAEQREGAAPLTLCVCEDGLDALTHPVYTAHMLQFSLFSPIWNRWMMQTSWPASQRADIMAHFTQFIFFFIFFGCKGSL